MIRHTLYFQEKNKTKSTEIWINILDIYQITAIYILVKLIVTQLDQNFSVTEKTLVLVFFLMFVYSQLRNIYLNYSVLSNAASHVEMSKHIDHLLCKKQWE